MKQKSGQSTGKQKAIVKGTGRAVLISVLVHAGLFLLAGMLVVFTVIKKEEQVFEPPQAVERPKMKLKKPKVKVKKSSRPKSSARITSTRAAKSAMPSIDLPSMGGLGDGLGGGIGGFDIMPDFDQVTMFGGTASIGNDLEGVLYDFKRLRGGKLNVANDVATVQSYVEKFIRSGWQPDSISKYYRSPKKLYSPMVMIPPTDSSLGPWAFGERDMGPWAYMLHYKGQLVHKDGIRFRFVAMGDNYLVIRVNDKVVLDYKNQFESAIPGAPFKPLNYHLGHWYAYAGDWIELEPGVPQDLEMILGDYRGYIFSAMVAVEVDGVEYPRAPLPLDNPQLPIFKTARLSADQIDAVYKQMWGGHLQLTNGPVFSDYGESNSGPEVNNDPNPRIDSEVVSAESEESNPRVWTFVNGERVEAEYVNLFGGKVVLQSPRGKTIKIPLSEFSAEDLEHLKLLNPPKLKIVFKKDTKVYPVNSNPELSTPIPVATEFAGGVTITQENMQDYGRPLRLELYVILDEIDGDNFILHDRQIEDFTLTPDNDRTFTLYGRKDVLLRYEHYSGRVRGEKYKGYMILVLNERDEIIAQNLSHDWLLDIRDQLLDFPIGRHFNKKGKRVHPPRPIFTSRYWEHSP